MKILRHIGSLAFVLGLFCAVFAGIPWYVIVADDPAVPGWLKIALFCLLGGILVVLLTVALEQRKIKLSEGETLSTEPESAVLLLNSSTLKSAVRRIARKVLRSNWSCLGMVTDLRPGHLIRTWLPLVRAIQYPMRSSADIH